MFDYEIMCYKIEFQKKDANWWFETQRATEKEAFEFVKANIEDWKNYRILQIRAARTDLYCE